MAINFLSTSSDKIPLLSFTSSRKSSKGSVIPNLLAKQHFATDSSIASSIKSNIRKNTNCKSPYFNSDKIHLLSRVTQKRVVQKKDTDFVCSFPLAVKIYKANSDEFKSVKQNKRVKKSVLTLPNEQAPAPQICTVSDMNDSEDFNRDDDIRKKRPKNRPSGQNRRSRNDFEFHDRDARYCSQFNIHLDHSSTDVIKKFTGDSKKTLSRKKQTATQKAKTEGKFSGHDVWRVLRNINRFQFRPSPPVSEENIPLPRKKDSQKRYNRKDTRFIETCRTEEFAYISSIEVDSKSPTSFSQCSSLERVTVIDKKDEFSRICDKFEKMTRIQNAKQSKKFTRNKNKSFVKKSLRTGNKAPGPNAYNQHIIPNNKDIDVKHSYKDNGFLSNHSSSVVNEESLTLNAHNEKEIKQRRHNGNIQNFVDRSEIDKNFKSPTNLVSSKTGLQNTSKVYDEVFMIDQNKICDQSLNGITKVVLSKGQDILPSKRLETLKRKPRLATTMTNASIVPKLTQTNIRRRLLNMTFPLIILDKDQVSSTIQVMDYDPPQFQGLDKHIWPFMIEWSDEYKLKTKAGNISKSNDILTFDTKCMEDSNVQKIKNYFQGDYKFNKSATKNLNISVCNKPSNGERKRADCKLVSKKLVKSTLDLNNNPEEPKKPKPIRQLKDKMLKWLYKKPLANHPSEVAAQITGKYDVQHEENGDILNEMKILSNIDFRVNTNDKINIVVNHSTKGQYLNSSNSRLTDNQSAAIKRPWAKAKWASDFIETVIKKIKSGVYYSQDVKYGTGNSFTITKEASVQTRLISEKLYKGVTCDAQFDQPSEQLLIKMTDLPKIIPGFDRSLPELQVKTLDTNKIEIKNCLANIIVQFDVIVPQESDKIGINTKKSCSFIPIEQNDSSTINSFKCKATILNAMLPAELCAILPDMMYKILHSDIKSSNSLPINKTDLQLSTISELPNFEGLDSFRTIPKLCILSPEIRHILSGTFSHSMKSYRTAHTIKNITIQSSKIIALLPKMPENVLIHNVLIPLKKLFRNEELTDGPLQVQRDINVLGIQDKICKTLQPYNHEKHYLIPMGHRFNLMRLFENMWTAFKMFGHIDMCSSTGVFTISLDLRKKEHISTKKVIIKMDNLKLDSIFENYAKINKDHNMQNKLNGNEYLLRNFSEPDVAFCETKSHKKINHIHGSNHKIKRKGFVKLYKKCKSTSNIPNENNNYPLSKINNLDDFFQLLGSKSLSCVFDGNSGKKILSSIVTMKNWISEINSRQAILVLLLANKKDTSNLIRFRPVLLQGIAVNRITRASELDMEIEVIEREKLNGFSQFDGISYLPASIENKDNLLEELYWIAKTTASDYQKPFDDSSEKLLKSLLEKRKQLNPSYLRVMARYVGLGLLKTPTKKTNLRC